jgi:hypothetical protein
MSGSRDPHARFVADAINKLNDTIEKRLQNTRPGDVLTAGIQQKPGLIGQQVVKDVARNSSIGTAMLKTAGMRR